MKRLYILFLFLIGSSTSYAYPIDGYNYTHIDRLSYLYKQFLVDSNSVKLENGALWMMEDIELSLVDDKSKLENYFEENKDLDKAVSSLFRQLETPYSFSVIDYSDHNNIKYGSHRDEVQYQPGSVGKLAIMIAFFTELDEVYDGDWDEMRGILNSKFVTAEKWAIPNHHTVPFYDSKKDKIYKRKVIASDQFSLYEWLDHMVSVSSNAAASIMWREAVILRAFGDRYECVSDSEIKSFFDNTPKSILSDIAIDVVNCPLTTMGIESDEWRLGSFFTSGSDQYIPPKGGSTGTTKGLLKFLVQLEKGTVVSERASLEMKRLMYLTDRRIRYARANSLDDSAVYFKSGSYYSCKAEAGFTCSNYAGNRFNYMNSIAMVETKKGRKYMVSLMSNVLRKNSVNEHLRLANQIDRLLNDLE